MMTSIAKRQWAVRSGLSQAVVMASSCTDNTKAPAEDIWELAFRNTVEVANWLWCLRLERQLERRCEASEMVHLLWMRSCIERFSFRCSEFEYSLCGQKIQPACRCTRDYLRN